MGYIYFAGDLGSLRVIKIGWTGRAWQERVAALQSNYPFELRPLLVIEGTLHEESQILNALAPDKTKRGRGEWFYPTERVLALIERLRSGIGIVGPLSQLSGRTNILEPAAALERARGAARSTKPQGDKIHAKSGLEQGVVPGGGDNSTG